MTQPATQPMLMQADLLRVRLAEPQEVGWSAVWGVFGQREGYESSDTDLSTLIGRVVESARDWAASGNDPLTPREGYDMGVLWIQWTIGGDVPPRGTVTDSLTASGVTLPSTAAEWVRAQELT